MKRAFLFLILTVIFAFANAQIDKNFLTIEGGVGFGQFYGNDYVMEHQSMRTSPQIGIGFLAPIGENLFFTTGFDYTKKGAWDITIAYEENSTVMYQSSFDNYSKYLTFPFMLGYQTKGKFSLGISAGVYLGILMQHKYEMLTGVLGIGLTTNDTEDYNMMDFGPQGQIMLRLHANENTFVFLGVTHQMGITNTYTKTLYGGGALKTSMSYLNFGVGFAI
ncbi:MAG: hypothetical protein C0592_11145 [Marinilabiliales bacterium]|nr:MAG: hypothetical protein C0592_11145 [Marinilabiliales bacterium]